MKEAMISIGLFLGLINAILIGIVILKKKSLVYKFTDKTKKITAFDYFTDFDGMWFFERIKYDQMIEENEKDKVHILSEQKIINLMKRIVIINFIIIFMFLFILKIFGLI